jgi:hypothetical protein
MGRKARREITKAIKPLKLYDHQQACVDAYVRDQIRKFYLVWHRRAGKDTFGLDFGRERMLERVGNYWHLFPFHIQAKRAIWKGIDARDGVRFIDRAFPDRLKERDNDTEMSIVLPNGSTWQMLGSDNYDRMVGGNPCGITFSEWALCDPAAWDYIRPILVENKGWVMFITTLRGRNHAYRMMKQLEGAEGWYVDIKTIEDTYRHDGQAIVTKEDVDKEIAEGMDAALARQEFYCDPDAASSGAIFGRQYTRLTYQSGKPHESNNRIVRIAWGSKAEGISAIAFQDNHVIAVHTFAEQNIVDAVQSVVRRHPNNHLVHHAVNPDPSLFSSLDGYGVVASPLTKDVHMQHGHVAAMLNICETTSIAKEKLMDFSMSYAPFRDQVEEHELTNDSLSEALAVMHTAQILRTIVSKPLDYSRADRGVI